MIAIIILVFLALVVVCIAMAERAPLVEDDQVTPEKPFLPEDFKPAAPLKRKRAARTPDRILRGIHEREQAHHG